MKKEKAYILMLFQVILIKSALCQSIIDLKTPVSMHAENITIAEFIKYLENHFEIQTGYFNEISAFDAEIHLEINDIPFQMLLDTVFHPNRIQYILLNNKLFLKESKPVRHIRELSGRVFDQQTKKPLPYSAVQLMSTMRGCISDGSGQFYMELKDADVQDSVIISMLGYESDTVSVTHILKWSDYSVYLKPVAFHIESVEINSEPGSFERLGNKGFLASGSMYMDTHGQQTALFIENDRKTAGRMVKVSYYLSKKGNTSAPFRIRIYKRDTITQAPGEDILKEIIIVTPDIDKGWYDINIARFNVTFPSEGLFVAIEGVYPDDFEHVYTGHHFVDGYVTSTSVDEINDLDLVSFGQRLGYNRKGDNNTWHYSITGEWFQVNKSSFNAMIAAEIKFYENEK